jgi:hypothetical protein
LNANQNQAAAQPQSSGGLFGGTQQQQPQPQSGSLFGAQPQAAQPQSGGLFGGAASKLATPSASTGGLFGASTTTQAQNQGTAQAGSLFGNANQSRPSLL